ncbi:MAG TPA: hypothetical protein VFO03_03910, partial [Gaiellaceae bacterium]|nr:hypothetical protein [Gaiellaceae bacterium]
MEGPELRQALARLFGPGAPEIGCDVCFARLDEYVDAEIAGRNVEAGLPGFKAHLDGCPACRE